MAKQYKTPVEQAEEMKDYRTEPQKLHDWALEHIFTPENAKKAGPVEKPVFYKRGDRVQLKKPDFERQIGFQRFNKKPYQLKENELTGELEVVGFYDRNNKFYEDNPYNENSDIWDQTHHGVKVRSLKTGREFGMNNDELKAFEAALKK